MDSIIKHLSTLDWILASATLVFGLATGNPWVIAAGLLGLVGAWYGPAARIKKYIARRMLTKSAKPNTTADALAAETFYAQMLHGADTERPVASHAPEQPGFGAVMPAGRLMLGGSRHNQLKAPHLNLHAKAPSATSWH